MQTAVKFLQNPNVVNTPLAQKQKFLQRKGLTDEEIQLACEQSGAYAQHELQSQPSINSISPRNFNQSRQIQIPIFEKIREIVHNIAIFSIVAYVINKFYQVSFITK